MTGTELVSFESYSDLFGKQATLEELTAYMARFSRNSVLWVCSYVNVALQLWITDGSESENLGFLLDHFFPHKLSAKLKQRHLMARDHQRILFHRRQLLFLAKMALIHCKESGVNASLHTQAFGPCFLHANDHFHFDIMPKNIAPATQKEDLAKLIAELLASEEYGQVQIPNVYTRSRKMCIEIPKSLQSHPDYCDIAGLFYSVHGLRLDYFQYLTFGIASRFGDTLSKSLQDDAMKLPMRHQDFVNTKATDIDIQRFFEIVSATPSAAARHPSLSRVEPGGRSKWASDATVFRQSPLILQWFGTGTQRTFAGLLLMDHPFLFQKVISEPYFSGLKVQGERFSRFWGAVFEEYVHGIFRASLKRTSAHYIRNPRLTASSNEELCDGAIVDGTTLVLLEYKSSLIRADKKYQGDSVALANELTEKLVFNTRDNNPKAVVQLAKAVKRLFGGASRSDVDWCNIKEIDRCYVVTVTLDTIGGAIGISTFLNVYFQEHLSGCSLNNLTLLPFFCTDIETLETLSGCLAKVSLASVLERWWKFNPPLSMPLITMRMDDLLPLRPDWLWDIWEMISDEAIRFLFGEISIEAEQVHLRQRAARKFGRKQ